MLLRIQRDESLRSFIARNLFLNWNGPEARAFDRLLKFSIRTNEVREIAAAMGWLGCFGFNRLLHKHTDYPRYSIFKIKRDFSYSHFEYLRGNKQFESNRVSATFCSECVRDDLASLGFSYWRRAPRSDVKVCPKHNVHLQSKCPFCNKPFSDKGHGLDVMWRGCAGRHLGESPSIVNEDSFELKKAKFIWDAFSLDVVVSVESALLAINERLRLFGAQGGQEAGVLDELRCRVNRELEVATKYDADNWFRAGDELRVIWESMLLLYDEFEQFLADVKLREDETRLASSLWSTYRAGRYPTAQYVEEDYAYGVGHWFCSNPSQFSPMEYADAGHFCPVLYPCCNYFTIPPPRLRAPPRHPRKIGCAPPGVPVYPI
ncbi:hypothetical protein ACNFH5_11610 [Pseudomonas sp. NY15435]|uniref:hypothetical protein n=1 Tax=Pseudomonas sp. NY15435 TaxID=3400358 RepID=UPI003A85209D